MIDPWMDSFARLASEALILLFSALAACVLPQQTAPYVSLKCVWRSVCGGVVASLAGSRVQFAERISRVACIW